MNNHTEFISMYCALWKEHFGSPYLFNGGKDAAAVKRLLAAGVTIEQVTEVLRDALPRTGYPWNAAVTISGFVSMYSAMVAERAKRNNPKLKQPLTRWDLQRQIDLVKEQISQHPHNPESIHEDRLAVVEVPLDRWRSKLEELKRQYALL